MNNAELIAKKDAIIAEQGAKIEALSAQLIQLQKLIFGSKKERFNSTLSNDQLNLFDLAEQVSQQEETEQVTYKRKKNKSHPGRNPLPDHLPVEEIIINPLMDIAEMKKIGEEITDTLIYSPAELRIKRTIRPKYKDEKTNQIHIAELPDRPFPKVVAEASLLAYILVSKFVDHLPYDRQRKRFKRDFKIDLSSSTINNWMAACYTLLKPLYNRMKQKILESDYIQADESPMKVLDPDKKGKTHLGYQWVYHAPKQGLVLFHYRRGRGMHGPKELLMNFQGYLQCDGYKVYDKIGQRPEIELVGCLVHARRKFFESKDSDQKRSDYALNIFKQIYDIERQIKQMSKQEKQINRIEKIQPLMVHLLEWIQKESVVVLPKSPIAKAMVYYQNQWPKLNNIFSNSELELDNNLIENKIRPLALGRKNYLFAGSDKGAEWAAMWYSFFATCKTHNVNPYEWLVNVMSKINQTSIQSLDQLLPREWGKQSV